MSFVILGLMLVALLVAIVGHFMILGAAFGESIVWGLVCLFVPFGILAFIVTHWEESKGGFRYQLGGICSLLLVTFLGMPTVMAERGAKEPTEVAPTQVVKCPKPTTPDNGYSLWCCSPNGWEMQAETGCSATYKPTETCDLAAVGTTRLAVCGTVGKKLKPTGQPAFPGSVDLAP